MADVTIDARRFSLTDLVGLLMLEEDQDVAALARRVVALERLCDARGLTVDADERRAQLNDWRAESGFESAADMRSWMREYGVGDGALKLFAAILAMESALLDSVTDAELAAARSEAQETPTRDVYAILCEDRSAAEATAAELRGAPERFFALAHARSIEPASRAACGYLGRMTKDELPEGLGEALFAIDPGEIVGPVSLTDLWAVCTAHPPVSEAPDEEADALREEIVETLLDDASTYAVVQRGYLD
ncbi:MAG: peptidylprolyl isomerase [Marivibrio sp.]|uniref:peptidylprolyl isomerase n=1 Tax=Marivibrio sp. TaxID=2039719 RepID=UPI0032EC813E